MNKKWVTIGVIGVLVLGGGYWGYKKFTTKPVVATNITAKAKMGDVNKVITATGTVSFPHSIPLTFPSLGRVVELNIQPGDTVKAGQVLAKIDDTKLQTAVLQQQANLTSAQAKLQTLEEGYNDQTRAQAQASLASAQQAVATSQQNVTTAEQNAQPSYLANQVLLAKQTVNQASDALAKAQQSGNTASIQPAQSTLNQALIALTNAENAQNGGAAQALASAQAQSRSAQANLTAAQYQVAQQAQGPKSGDIQSAQASIAIAQAQLASAQTDLANATIIAPTDAVVVTSPLQLYEYTTLASIITLTPVASNLQVDASIDQADISQIKAGQKVDITLDAYPDEHSSGTVTLVALQGTTASNVTTFKVTVTVDKASDKLRSGMNANINIVVAEAKNVLTVPSEAIKTRGTKKEVTVPVATGANSTTSANTTNKVDQAAQSSTKTNSGSGKTAANVQYVPVEIGLDDGTNVEIKSGLKEGQEVVIGTRSSTTTTKSTSGFSLGGGNRGSGGGNAGGPPN
ncbi:efflux RND transporter periplasmic adaptor subunit [Desulfosporosinus metallidurans]|uniref:Macrolide-specific efflux protein MacA n=1 Tax=Desulfosporosinus metallidurans TaxID=1888891 RepID=A0A1Q8QXT2_9FIRM|nr:HlyD family efflux transporter periplasmic adaptor subunit [Desulfosporosinus metallidurans]OLN32105.1 Macrolide-specific efflux protein MacA [Desulfosporosinus metallidurans]